MRRGTATAALPLEAATERAGGMRDEIARGLDQLAQSPPLWPLDAGSWSDVVASVHVFADRWDAEACAAGWSDLELYGLHRIARYGNLSAMGAAFVIARVGGVAIAVFPERILMRSDTGTGALLQLPKFALSPEAVIAWSLSTPRTMELKK